MAGPTGGLRVVAIHRETLDEDYVGWFKTGQSAHRLGTYSGGKPAIPLAGSGAQPARNSRWVLPAKLKKGPTKTDGNAWMQIRRLPHLVNANPRKRAELSQPAGQNQPVDSE